MPHADALTPPAVATKGAWRRLPTRLAGRLVVRLHALADRFEQVPPEFGRDAPVDVADAAQIRREWLRLLRQWAAYNPEEVFAAKVGGVMLVLALAALWIGVGALR